MRKFISIFIVCFALLCSQTATAQFSWRGPYKLTTNSVPWEYIQTSSTNDMRDFCMTYVGGSTATEGECWYQAPDVGGSSLYTGFAIYPTDAGDITQVSGQYIKVKWKKEGTHSIAGYWTLVTNNRVEDLVVNVTKSSTANANFTLTNINNCPSPYGGFTVTRSNPSSPIKRFYLDIAQCNADGSWMANGQFWRQNDNGTASAGWSSGNMTTHTPTTIPSNFLLAGRSYRVKLAVATACSGWEEKSQFFTVKTAGVPVATGTISPDGLNNTGLTPATRLRRCSTLPLTFSNTTTNGSCGGLTMRFYVQKYTDASYTNLADSPEITDNVSSTATHYLTNLPISSKINSSGFYKISIQAKNGYGTSPAKDYYVQTSTLGAANSEFNVQGVNFASGDCYQLPPAAPRSTAFLNPVLVGATTVALVAPPAWQGDLTRYTVNLWTCTPNGLRIGTIPIRTTTGTTTSWLAGSSLRLNPKMTNYFTANYTTMAADNLFIVELIVGNPCGVTPTAQVLSSYIRVDKNCPIDALTIGSNGENSSARLLSDTQAQNRPSVILYPNPATNNINLTLENMSNDTPASLEILDIQGKVVKTVFQNRLLNNMETIDIDLTDFTNGLYFYRLNSDKVYSGKFIKQ